MILFFINQQGASLPANTNLVAGDVTTMLRKWINENATSNADKTTEVGDDAATAIGSATSTDATTALSKYINR